jgi:hypothetical protein
MGILEIILTVLILILAYILLVPITINLNLRIAEKVSAESAIKAFPFRYRFSAEEYEKKAKKPKQVKTTAEKLSKKEKRKQDFSKINLRDITLLLETAAEAFRFAGRLLKAPEYYVKAELSGGAAAPDITGEIYGAYQALKPILPRSIAVSYNPDFTAEKFSGTVRCGLVIRIITIVKEFLLFIFRLPIIRLIKLYRKLY